MSEDHVVLHSIEELIDKLPPEARAQVDRCATTLRQLMMVEGQVGEIALALVGAENAARAAGGGVC